MDLSYLNARVYGWKGRLLGDVELKRLLATEDIDAFAALLKATSFGPDMEVAGAKYTGANSKSIEEVISTALDMNLESSLAALWKNAPEGSRIFLSAVLSSWEVFNLKGVIRGVERGIPREDILGSIVGLGDFDHSAVNELSGAKDLIEIVRILKSWGSIYAAPLKACIKSYMRTKSLAYVEFSLDVFAFNHHLKRFTSGSLNSLNSKIAREVLTDNIDAANIITLFKVVGEGYTKEAASSLFIPKGTRLSLKTFLRLTEVKEREELAVATAEEVSDSSWKKLLFSTDLSGALTLEEGFEFLSGGCLIRRARVEPHSIAPSYAYIYRKVREVKNLRLILRGKFFSIPSVELQDLIMVYGRPFITSAAA